jgi:CRISPR-associated exonuclease Cas4
VVADRERGVGSLVPVEFKLGKRRRFENDDAQLCAQALCLEEMFGTPVLRGAIFHASSKRRREVEFTPELRALTEQAAAQLHALLRPSETPSLKSQIPPLPPAVFRPACEGCSLYAICLPRLTDGSGRVERATRHLFEI